MTMHFVSCNFMIGFLLDNKTSAEVTRAIEYLKKHLVENSLRFGEVFHAILTDNGGKFAHVFAIENDAMGQQESHLFFCDPYQSSQKPHVKKTTLCSVTLCQVVHHLTISHRRLLIRSFPMLTVSNDMD